MAIYQHTEAILRRVNETMDNLRSIREYLVDEAIKNGATWQDIAKVDKLTAVKLYRDMYLCSLHDAMSVVESYLAAMAACDQPTH